MLAPMRTAWWLAIAVAAFWLAHGALTKPEVRAESVIDLVYLGGPDCPYCRAWEARELPRLREMPEYPHIRYTHVLKMISSPVPERVRLPFHLAPMHDELIRQTGGRTGSPQFVLLVDGHAVDGGFGTQAYHALLPNLSELVARKRASSPRNGDEIKVTRKR
jgi:hypothetical protein